MNKLLMIFFLLVANLAFQMTPAFSTTISCEMDQSNLLNCFWDDDEDYLYFNVNALNGWTFDNDYYSESTKENQICEISLTIPEERKVISEKLGQLKKITVLVDLETSQLDQIKYTCISVFAYEKIDADGIMTSISYEEKGTGIITGEGINLTEEPIFFTLINREYTGVICFKCLNSKTIKP